MKLILDSNVLGMVCHPRKHSDVRLWFRGVLGFQLHTIVVPELADYELRRKLLHIHSPASLAALDKLAAETTYLPLDTPTMRLAAELWASVRSRGLPTDSDEALGGDAILAAQALRFGAVVVTDNTKHLGRMVEAKTWREL